MSEDDVRRKILERRTRFVVAAIASAGISAGTSACCEREDGGLGEPCLSIAQPEPDGSASEPMVCLKVAPKPSEGGVEEVPTVCLSVPMPSDKPPG
jgi:hypothetical protein